MIRLAADENLNGALVCGLLRQKSDLDLVRIQDVGLLGADDSSVLAWATSENHVLLTRDVATIMHDAYERVRVGLKMSDVFEINRFVPVATAIDDILLLASCSLDNE